MPKYLSQLLILGCLLGQAVNSFGLSLAFSPNQTSVVSLQFKGCCTPSEPLSSCCINDCKCCSSNDLPSDDLALVQENPRRQGVQILWVNPVSTNKCKGTNLISQFGIEMAFQEMDSIELALSSDSNYSTSVPFLSCGVNLSKFKPPRI